MEKTKSSQLNMGDNAFIMVNKQTFRQNLYG